MYLNSNSNESIIVCHFESKMAGAGHRPDKWIGHMKYQFHEVSHLLGAARAGLYEVQMSGNNESHRYAGLTWRGNLAFINANRLGGARQWLMFLLQFAELRAAALSLWISYTCRHCAREMLHMFALVIKDTLWLIEIIVLKIINC